MGKTFTNDLHFHANNFLMTVFQKSNRESEVTKEKLSKINSEIKRLIIELGDIKETPSQTSINLIMDYSKNWNSKN